MTPTKIVSISLTDNILKDLERIKLDRGFMSRSEVIRNAIVEKISEIKSTIQSDDRVFATIIVISEFDRHDIDKKLSKLRHEYNRLVIEDIHRHVEEKYCVETFHAEGKNSEITNLIGRIRGIKGITQLKYSIISLT